ncbi:MAG: hypothetical protein AAF989_08825, partial [Planctomycetota bacterium]
GPCRSSREESWLPWRPRSDFQIIQYGFLERFCLGRNGMGTGCQSQNEGPTRGFMVLTGGVSPESVTVAVRSRSTTTTVTFRAASKDSLRVSETEG